MAPPDPTPYGFTLAARAVRQLDALPPRVAVQIVEFIANRLVTNPRRIGKPLARELAGQWSARIDAYRVLYVIDEDSHRIRITRIAPRSNAYRL
ncbi:type II toxin-antitoxin system RelE family toxin [Actinomycetospora soli]|uniref:type II toxin-antitoxin system RelE family toxin n=1 Tax=Actinomycetospora soli TaxID=2893887 RepID=UPI001E3C0B68|nr:type II toxin-antitoxin system RelE/ParE family toxin [Actinomycetospora soli]MCD2191727.1 type II toxin-antitoxin system RelE/ParE family toxin [Actinomycetospora soli]